MPTATKPRSGSLELVSRPSDSVIYWARRSALRLTLKPRYPLKDPLTGQREGMTQGIFAGFIDGKLQIPKEGMVTIRDTLDGGEFEIEAEKMHALLGKHRLFGDRMEGFWMHEETAPPVTQEEMDRIVQAATEWDSEKLQAIAEAERAGWNREAILKVAKGSLDRIEESRNRIADEALTMTAEERERREEAEKRAVEAEKRAKAAEAQLKAAQKEK